MIKKLTTDEFVERSKKIHGEKYDYSLVNYINSITKIHLICPKHGKFYQFPKVHLNGCDCIKCGYEKTHKNNKYTLMEWISKASEIHDKKYDYSLVNYINCDTKISINCKKHGIFLQTPDCHLQGRGCPKCNASKAESIINRWLNDNNITYVFQKEFCDCKNPKTDRKLKFDFYIPSKNLLIEFDGIQHKKLSTGKFPLTKKWFKNNKFRDNIKTDYALKNNIQLLRISYKEFSKIPKILSIHLM